MSGKASVRFLAGSLWTTLATVAVLGLLSVAVAVGAFGLTASGGTTLFFVIWWTTLFAVLPFGSRSQVEAGEVSAGTEPGAPAVPALREKAIWTSLASACILVIAAAVMPLAGL